jgi:hypothetical protein
MADRFLRILLSPAESWRSPMPSPKISFAKGRIEARSAAAIRGSHRASGTWTGASRRLENSALFTNNAAVVCFTNGAVMGVHVDELFAEQDNMLVGPERPNPGRILRQEGGAVLVTAREPDDSFRWQGSLESPNMRHPPLGFLVLQALASLAEQGSC